VVGPCTAGAMALSAGDGLSRLPQPMCREGGHRLLHALAPGSARAASALTAANDRTPSPGMGRAPSGMHRGVDLARTRRCPGAVADGASSRARPQRGTRRARRERRLSEVVGGALPRGRVHGGHRQTSIPGVPAPQLPRPNRVQTDGRRFTPGRWHRGCRGGPPAAPAGARRARRRGRRPRQSR
jgi:hypothetical protein